MSRINTNVSSLTAQNTLGRNNADLQTALQRLSTGLRINTGKDDPAGLIASETLRRDITAVDRGITNRQRAGQLIATADSALGQVSSLLNDIRGLVTEAANSGVVSDEQLAANQLQIDSSLEAIDRIAQTTTFQGKKILDGSLQFLTQAGSGFSTVTDLKIDQANLGATGSIEVNVNISVAATQASITNALPTTAIGQLSLGGQSFTLQTDPSFTGSSVAVDLVVNDDASATGRFSIDGYEFVATATGTSDDNIDLVVTEDALDHAARAELTFDGTVINIQADQATTFDNATVALVKSALGATADSSNVEITDVVAGGGNDVLLNISANANGAAGDDDPITITLASGVTASGDVDASFNDGTNTLTITLDNTNAAITQAEIEAAIEAAELSTNPGTPAVPQLFTVNSIAGAATIDGTTGTTGLTGTSDTTLTREEATASYDAASNTLTITLNSDLTTITAQNIITAIETDTNFNTELSTAYVSGPSNITVANVTASATYGTLVRPTVLANYDNANDELELDFDGSNGAIDINDVVTAIDGLAEFSGTESVSSTGTIVGSNTAGTQSNAITRLTTGVAADFNSNTNRLTLTVAGNNTSIDNADILTAINGLAEFTGSTATDSSGSVDGSELTSATDVATAATVQDLVVRVGGYLGSEVFTFQAGATFQQIADAISLVSDAIGVNAAISGSDLELTSTRYGSNGFVDIEVISEGSGGTFEANLSATRAAGTDVVATVNGIEANGDGNQLSVNTSTLDLTLTVEDGSSTDVNFTINGGGAVFQLGPDVVSNQQAQIGIGSIATGVLGGVNGRLYELRSGNGKSLVNDTTGAQRIVDEVITKVVELRGRLGAFQRTTLESNIASLQDTLVNLTEAQSSIRDADFAKESAALTRAQILVQSGTSVLAIANQNPQNVLALLR